MGRNLGRAIESIGDDVLGYSKLKVQEEALRLREERERLMMESRERIANARIDAMERRMGSGGGRDADGGWVPDQSDERVAAEVNSRQPDGADIITGPRVAGVRSLLKSGPQTETKATADTPGMEYLSNEDRQQLASKGDAGMRGETVGTMQARRDTPRVSRGIVATSMDPKVYDDYQKGRTTGTILDTALTNPEGGRQLARNAAGKDRFSVEGDEKVDEGGTNPGFKGQTEQGKAKVAAARELGDLRDRTDPNRPRGGGGGGGANTPEYKAEKELLDGVERQLEKANASLATAENNQVNALGDSGRKAAQALVEQRRAEVQKLEARAAEHRQRMQRIADGAPRGTPPAGGGKVDEAKLRAQANAAISGGANAAAVKERFKTLTGKDL